MVPVAVSTSSLVDGVNTGGLPGFNPLFGWMEAESCPEVARRFSVVDLAGASWDCEPRLHSSRFGWPTDACHKGVDMRSMLTALATAVSMALLAGGVAVADTVTSDFEPPVFHLGSVDGQDGWTSAKPSDIPASCRLGMTRRLSVSTTFPDSAFSRCAIQTHTTSRLVSSIS